MSRALPRRPICYDLGIAATNPGATFSRVAARPVAGQYTSDDWAGERTFAHSNNRRPITITCAVWNGQTYTLGVLTQKIQS